MAVAQDGMEAYKVSKEFHDEKINYSAMTYLIEKNEVRSKVAIRFSSLVLTFLDEESEEEDDDEAAPEPEADANPLAATNPLSTI